MFRRFRTTGVGEKMILEDNAFVERVLPGSVMRKLSDEEMAQYRAPFPTPQSRKPVLAFPRELPIEGQPADVYGDREADHAALRPRPIQSCCSPPIQARWFRRRSPRVRGQGSRIAGLVNLGPGAHYLQEDHADAIGGSIAGWIAQLESAPKA